MPHKGWVIPSKRGPITNLRKAKGENSLERGSSARHLKKVKAEVTI